MLKRAITVDTEKVRGHLDEVVRSTVEVTLSQLLNEEADRIVGAGKYERSAERKDTRAGSDQRKLQSKGGEVELTVPRLRKLPLETAIIERYKRRKSSVEESGWHNLSPRATDSRLACPCGQRRHPRHARV